ncbi:hypothetical protein LB521_04545 [Mesorhizobium sp. BR-1-1-8]|uniref:hypothetical protein n=1 Tax=Mesorhizobium sp. BR-1-1-8 TaxID=2876659 RepID=UPI001CCF6A1A|nr:hypothetical protein [Mesorhizobium sp. BR-1-1-8]MBZ9980416.1 hypothetical protein [Mesorhizobium sp. BR-1-1-8]
MQLEPRILFIRETGESPSPKGFRKIALFDVAFGDGFTAHDWRLVETPTGGVHAYAPDLKNGAKSADLAPAFRDLIADLAVKALGANLALHSTVAA